MGNGGRLYRPCKAIVRNLNFTLSGMEATGGFEKGGAGLCCDKSKKEAAYSYRVARVVIV